MQNQIIRRQTPEEQELERKRIELGAIENELAERELDLSTLEAELRAFERKYLRTVGIKYAELDDLEAQIAEAKARLNPQDTQAQQHAQQSRTQAEESAQAAGTAKASKQKDEFKPSDDIKKLYRELAKRFHPDLANDETERANRTQMMAEINRAYQDGDIEKLQVIVKNWEHSPEAIKGDGIGADLVRIIRKIALVRERLGKIELKITQLHESDLHKLMMKVREAQQQGRNLLVEMAATLDEQIVSVRKQLAEIKSRCGNV